MPPRGISGRRFLGKTVKPGLKQAVRPDWGGFPPHMSAGDQALWVNFRDIYARDFKFFYYDVLVGIPSLEMTQVEPELQGMVNQITRMRVDAVGEKENEWWIIEFRPNASLGAIGSVLGYKTLWEEDPPDERPVKPVIVTDYHNENVKRVCEILKIELILV